MDKVGITEFRKNIYQLVDQVILSGKPLVINRNGKKLVLTTSEDSKPKLKNLKPHKAIVGNPDDLVDLKVHKWTKKDNL